MKAVYTLDSITGTVIAECFEDDGSFFGGFTWCAEGGKSFNDFMNRLIKLHEYCTKCGPPLTIKQLPE